jgi:hypothetical protein
MSRRLLLPLSAMALIAVPAASNAQYSYDQNMVGPEIGVFQPNSAALRAELGSEWLSYGLGQTRVYGRQTGPRKTTSWNGISQTRNGSKVFMASASFGYVVPLGQSSSNFRPYIAGRFGGSYVDYAVDVDGGRLGGKKTGWNANAEFGIIIGQNITVSARYDAFPEYDGLSFNGLSLSVKYGMLRF